MSAGAISRRRALALAGAAGTRAALLPDAGLAQAVVGTDIAAELPKGKFFTAHELATLDEVAELIIPADTQSGGARAARCAEYIEARLAESIDPLWRQSWKDDLAEIDEVSIEMFGRPLLAALPAERQKLMQRISSNERNPKENVDHSFVTIKWWVAEAYYTSKIGIHDELKYEGNSFIDEFIGTDAGARHQ